MRKRCVGAREKVLDQMAHLDLQIEQLKQDWIRDFGPAVGAALGQVLDRHTRHS